MRFLDVLPIYPRPAEGYSLTGKESPQELLVSLLWQKVTACRIAMGISQRHVANHLGFTPSTYSRYESKINKECSLSTFFRIADILQIRASILIHEVELDVIAILQQRKQDQ